MKTRTILAIAFFCFSLSFIVINRAILRNDYKAGEQNEAYEALSFWAKARMYPQKKFPRKGFSAAFEKTKSFSSAGKSNSWEPIGPKNFGGRTISIAINPENPNTVYVGSASGGLWRSYSAGEGASAWNRIETGFPVLGIGAIAISSVDTNVIFIGTGEVYAYQNSTGGIVNRLTRGSYGLGILKTTDGGVTWSKSLDWSMRQERGVQSVKINPKNANTVYAGTTEGFFISYDCGDSWIQKNNILMVTDIVVNPNDTNKILIACGNFGSEGHGIYRTTDGGNVWEKISNGLPASYNGKAVFSVYGPNPDTVFASIGGGLSGTWLCKTTNFGESWTIVSTEDYARYQGWFSHIVVVSQNNPDEVIAGGVDLYKSYNGGNSFEQKSNWWQWYMGRTIAGEEEGPPTYSHADHHCYAVNPQNPDVVYFGNDGGVFVTTDFGETFHGRNGGYQTQQFYNGFSSNWYSGSFSIGGLQDNASAIYDGQLNWIRVIGADGAWTAINGDSPNIIFGSYYYLSVLRSENRGNSWQNINIPDAGNTAFIAPFIISHANQNVMYAAGSKVLKSTNRGISWRVKSEPSENPAISMDASWQNVNKLFVGFAPENGVLDVMVTTDGGVSWSNISAGLPNRYPMDIAVDPMNDNRVYVVFSGFGSSHVFRSEDEGETWLDINGDLPDVPTNAVAIDPDFPNYVYVGNDVGVFVSSDYGETWRIMKNGMKDSWLVMDLSVTYGDTKIIAVTHGNGAFVTDLISAVNVEETEDNVSDFSLYQNFPNPFNSETTIRYSVSRKFAEKTPFVSLKIYDVRGREVETLVNKRQSAGEYSVKFNTERLYSGTYFYRLTVGGKSLTKKMILLK